MKPGKLVERIGQFAIREEASGKRYCPTRCRWVMDLLLVAGDPPVVLEREVYLMGTAAAKEEALAKLRKQAGSGALKARKDSPVTAVKKEIKVERKRIRSAKEALEAAGRKKVGHPDPEDDDEEDA